MVQPVIKPALVGLAGPWVSGGIEFNWPQHHRPATFLPVDFEMEEHPDGGKTLWCSDHDPMARMKGMHGVCLAPGKAYLGVKVRVYNRTPLIQTFLWWANVAVRVHEGYQSFFPPDVGIVADHARCSMSRYSLAEGRFYGVDYGQRARRAGPRELEKAPAKIDYFATSLPNLLLFEDDLQPRQETLAWLLQAQAAWALGQTRRARRLLRAVLDRDPNHAIAADLAQALSSTTLSGLLTLKNRR